MRQLVIIAVFTGVVVAGCDSSFTRPEPNPPSALAVTSILNPSADTQAVALTKVANPLPDSESAGLVPDATVRVGGVLFNERLDGPSGPPARYPRNANYQSAQLDVQPGSTYSLDAAKNDLALSGTVAVPDTFVGKAEGRRLLWTRSKGAARYHVHIEDAAGTSFHYLHEYTVFDTTTVVEDDDFTPGAYYVEITAQDSNLTAFMRDETDSAGVTGGYGVFGARTTIAGTVQLTKSNGASSASSTPPTASAPSCPLRPRK